MINTSKQEKYPMLEELIREMHQYLQIIDCDFSNGVTHGGMDEGVERSKQIFAQFNRKALDLGVIENCPMHDTDEARGCYYCSGFKGWPAQYRQSKAIGTV